MRGGRRRRLRVFFICFVCYQLSGNAIAGENALPFQLKEMCVETERSYPVDVDGDGTDELLEYFTQPDRPFSLRCYRSDTTPVWQVNLPGARIDASPFVYYSRTGELRIALGATFADSAALVLLSGRGEILSNTVLAHGIDRNRDGRWDGILSVKGRADCNGDGQPELLLFIHTGYDLYPRELIAYDETAGRLLWRFTGGCFCRRRWRRRGYFRAC